MKKIPLLQKLFEKFRKRKSGYRSEQLRSHNVPGSKGNYSVRRNRIARIKHWLSNRNNQSQQGYKAPSKKNRARHRLGWLFFYSSVVLMFFAMGGVTRLQEKLLAIDLFLIDGVEITGNTIVPNEKIKEASGVILHQTSMLGIRKGSLEDRLQAIPWVASAKVRKDWPSSVEIEIRENIPLALLDKGVSSEPQLHYIDKYGVSFLPVIPGGKVDLPVITGLSLLKDSSLKEKALSDALIFLQKVRRNDPHLPAHSVSEVHVNGEGKLIVYLVEYPFPIFFGNGDTKQSYRRLVQVLKALYKKEKGKNLISKIEYIQMDYLQDKVLVAQTGSG